MNKLLKAFTRTKHLKPSDFHETPLNRCLTTLDLTTLGVGGTLGSGIYVLTGEVARLKAGPSILFSFTIAGLASILCGLCYAEFGARFPKAGSAYIYSYVTIGELCAFTIGWNLVLEYIVGAAAMARAWSSFFDSMLNNHVREFVENTFGTVNVPFLSKYPDILAFLTVAIVVFVVAIGVKQSLVFNWVFTILNTVVILFVTITGLYFAELKNWSDFFPFGLSGVMGGAAILFYAFLGFDVIATCGEEANSPGKSIPAAIIACLVFCFFAYLGVSVALTLMVPYYKLAKNTSVATAFEQRGFIAGKYFVAMGAVFGLLSGLNGLIFPLPRVLYSMATDRVIFGFLGRINKWTETPLIACIISGFLTALLALFLDLISLVEMMSIGTLLAYTIVALSVLLLRYKPGNLGIQIEKVESLGAEQDEKATTDLEMESSISKQTALTEEQKSENLKNDAESEHIVEGQKGSLKTKRPTSFYKRLIGWQLDEPTQFSYNVVKMAIAAFVLLCATLESCLIYGLNSFTSQDPVMYTLAIFFFFSILFVAQVIAFQPQSKNELIFKVPLVPLVPLLSIFMNIYLILMLSFYTWIRFIVWMTLGLSIYLFYGIKHSKENPDYSGEREKTEYTKLNATDDEDKSHSMDHN